MIDDAIHIDDHTVIFPRAFGRHQPFGDVAPDIRCRPVERIAVTAATGRVEHHHVALLEHAFRLGRQMFQLPAEINIVPWCRAGPQPFPDAA